MPNWSFNTMRVCANDENEDKEVKRLRDYIEKVSKDKDGNEIKVPISFQNIIPMPVELEGTTSPSEEPNQDLIDKYGFDNWYDWRWKNWGTKWDACDAHGGLEEGGVLTIRFDTAWSFPTPIAVELSKQFPTLLFEYDAVEESGEFDMTVHFKNGKVVYYSEWRYDCPGDEHSRRREYPLPPEEFWK